MSLTSFHGHKFGNEVKLVKAPSVIFTEQVIKDMEAIVTLCKDEVTWFGVVVRDEMEFYINEILVPPQENTRAMSDIMEHGMVVMAEELLNEEDGMERFNALRFYCHSHVNMGTGPSGQDETQTKEFGEQCGDFLIRGICNKAGRLELTLFLYTEGIVIKDVEWAVLKEEDDMSYLKQWQNFLEERVKPPPHRPAPGVMGFHGGHGGAVGGRHSRRRWEGQVYRNGKWGKRDERKIPEFGYKAKTVMRNGLTEVEYYDGRVEIFETSTGEFIRLTYPGDRRWMEDEKKKTEQRKKDGSGTNTPVSGSPTTGSNKQAIVRERIVVWEEAIASRFRADLNNETTDNITRDINGIPLIANRIIHHWARPPFLVGESTAVGIDAFAEFKEVADALIKLHMSEFDELLQEKIKNLINLYSFEIDAILENKFYYLHGRWFFDWEPLDPEREHRILEDIFDTLHEDYSTIYSDPQEAPSEDEKTFIEFMMVFKFACQLHLVEERLEYENLKDYIPIFKEDYLDSIKLHEAQGGV